MRLARCDSDFRVMLGHTREGRVPASELGRSIRSFRSKISLNWINQFSEQCQLLSDVFDVLLALAEDENHGIRIAANNTVGATFFLLTPFIPKTVANSFSGSLLKIRSCRHASVTIIACLCHLSKCVSFSELKAYFSRINVRNYLSEELRDNLKFLPKLLKKMGSLDADFHISLMVALIDNFGNNPSIPLINSIFEIIRHYPKVGIEEFLKYTKDKKMEQLILMITPVLLEKDVTRICLMEKDYVELIDLAVSIVMNENLGLKEVEYAIGTISSILKYSNDNSFSKKIEGALNSRDLPIHLKIFTLQVSNNIDELRPKENDSVHLKLFKLMGIANILQRDNNLLKDILPILDCYLNDDGEILSKLMEIFSDISDIITFSFLQNEDIHHYVHKFVSFFINKKTGNWVQKISLLKFIRAFDIEVGNYLINNYEKIVLEIVFEYCFSKQEYLRSKAIKTLLLITRYNSISFLIQLLYQSNFFNDFDANISVQIIYRISNVFDPSLFKPLESIIVESILLNPTYIKFICSSLKFLNLIKSNYKSQEIIQLCFDLISKIFKSYTGIEKNLHSSIKSENLPPIVTLIETNIIEPTFDSFSFILDTIQQCLIYLNGCNIFNENLLMISIQLLKIYPVESLQFIFNNAKSISFIKSKSFGILLKDVIVSTNSFDIACFCLNYYIPFANLDDLVSTFVENSLSFVNNGKQLYSLYLYMSELNQTNKCDDILEKLDQKNQNLYHFFKIQNSLNEILEWLNNIPFANYPLHDKTFIDFLEENIGSICILDCKLPLPKEHMLFISRHPNLFSDKLIQEIKQIDKIFMFKYFKDNNNYIYHNLNINIKESSIQENLESKQNILIYPKLVSNFFEFSSHLIKIDDQCFNKMIKYLLENNINLIFALKYATENKIRIHKEILDMLFYQIHDPNILLCLTKYMLKMEFEIPETLKKKTSLSLLEAKVNENDYLIQINPQQVFTEFTKSYSYKSKESKCIYYFLNRFDLNPMIIIKFLYKKVQNICSISSIKKLIYFLKIIHLFFHNLFINNNFDIPEIKLLISEIISNIGFLETCKYASIHNELSNIFYYIPFFTTSFVQVISFINNIHISFGSSILYLIPSCNISIKLNNHNIFKFLTSNILNYLIKFNIPSFILKVHRTIKLLLKNYSCMEICYYSIYPSIVDILKTNGDGLFVQNSILELLKIVSSEHKYDSFQRLIYPELKYLLTMNIQKKSSLQEFAIEAYKLLFSQ